MIKKNILILIMVLNFSCFSTYGNFVELKFSSKNHELLYKKLITELKCLVCQNQSLAESDAELAVQLRGEIYNKVESGQKREEILNYVTDRYGEFVLLRPAFSRKNFLLWGAPLIFLVLGLTLISRKLK